MRRVLLALVRWLAEALVRLYYPARAVEGAERIPAGRPVVFVVNHPNGLLDPLVLRVATGRPARFLAKSTLFGNPFGRLAMDAFGSLPVYRVRDAGARANDVTRNDETFARCRAALARGEALALFPEGTSHSDPQLKPLKTGAARIALSAEREFADATTGEARLRAVIVPVGLFYERKARFRSRVLLVVGEPVETASLLPRYLADERATVDALTDEIRARIGAVVLQAETNDLLVGIARVARWTADKKPADDVASEEALAADVRRARELVEAYERLRARDPARVDAVVAEARAYTRTLRHLGVRDPWALELEPIAPRRLLVAVGKALVAAPIALVGAILGWGPYRLAGIVAERVTKEEDVLGTVKLIAGATFLFVAWAAEAAVAAAITDRASVGVAVFLIGVSAGYVALWFDELVVDTALAVRTLWLRAFHFDMARQLGERRRALADSVSRALEEASTDAS
ncbi:MAG TPA: lysophospholipid acyltransferase family protein [Polyangia bacterium]|nr:lysophospholipid acyltransferase family protein [Polyangia bacterium]